MVSSAGDSHLFICFTPYSERVLFLVPFLIYSFSFSFGMTFAMAMKGEGAV